MTEYYLAELNRSLVAMQFANSYFFRKKFLPLINWTVWNFVLVDDARTREHYRVDAP